MYFIEFLACIVGYVLCDWLYKKTDEGMFWVLKWPLLVGIIIFGLFSCMYFSDPLVFKLWPPF
ncbi:hypothetical protein [Fervidobacterium sp. 2310opik-2]|uniref:hypothetical protein n=1 Tax=Fervidobacterium sp. 2310opik-2 TaxID=1755815 RepID=UPI0013E01086|nr:hypothetical protein [Fervidobacterium sp. 2310opik-2]KAF2961044.1 hypothetical protein AS161_03455 [Fervidobacterium sp. 2310opik-2]